MVEVRLMGALRIGKDLEWWPCRAYRQPVRCLVVWAEEYEV